MPSSTTTALAAAILATHLGRRVVTLDGPLYVSQGGWSREREVEVRDTPAYRDAVSVGDYRAALGPYQHATLTADGRGARRDMWCRCAPAPAVARWVRYEHWTTLGRTGHGFLCPTCRGIVQAG